MNPRIPDLPHPVDLQRECTLQRPVGFTSSTEYNIYCYQTARMIKGYGNGWSTVSQEDADEMAITNAAIDAHNRINCLTTPIGGSTIG